MNPDPNPLFPYGLSFLSSLSLPSLPVTTAQQLPMSAFANATAGAFFSSRAFWGPVTATLDWCEVSPRFAVYPGSHPLPAPLTHFLSHLGRQTTSSRVISPNLQTPSPTCSRSPLQPSVDISRSRRVCHHGIWQDGRCVRAIRTPPQ